jgi:plastocyanin domain-containing protein
VAFPLTLTLAPPLSTGCKGSDAQASTADPSAQTVAIEANEKGFTPSSVAVKKGAKMTLVFTRTTDATCATQVVFPELKVTKDLPLHQAVSIEVPTGDARTLTFQCGMGMFKGKVVVSS